MPAELIAIFYYVGWPIVSLIGVLFLAHFILTDHD